MALKFSRKGAVISVLDINFEHAEQTVKLILAEGHKAIAIQCDVTNHEAVNKAVDTAENEFGPVDILINNAGVVAGYKVLETTENRIKRTIDVNTTALAWTVRKVLPKMLERNSGHIVTIAS